MTTEEKIHAVKELLGPFAANFAESTVNADKWSDDHKSVPEPYVFGYGRDLGEWLSKAPNSIFPPGARAGLRMLSNDGIGEIFTDLVGVMLGLQGCELERGRVPWALKDIDTTVYPNKTPDKNPPTGC